MKNHRKALNVMGVAALTILLSSNAALAQDSIQTISTTWKAQFIALGKVAGMVAFLAGFVLGIMGLLKLKANAANPNDPSNKVSTAFIFIFTGAALIAIPTVMGVGVGSLFGASGTGDTVTLDAGSAGFTKLN